MECILTSSPFPEKTNCKDYSFNQQGIMYSLPYSVHVNGLLPVSSESQAEAGMMTYTWEGNYQALQSDGASSSCSSGTTSDQEPVASPVTSSPPPRVYKPCFVCSDRSSGYHYGVSSCEGCKGFFRRSIQKNMQYTCQFSKCCVITKMTRSRCQFCRLQKCLAVGMLRESVRNERRKKRGKEKKTSANPESNIRIPHHIEELLRIMSDAHTGTSPSLRTIEKFRTNSLLQSTTSGSSERVGSVNMNLWTQFSQRSAQCIIKIVDFAKLIPGFTDFTIADQITLIKAASMDVLVLRLCSRFQPDDDTMTFSDGLTLDRTEMQSCGFGPITDAVYKFAKNIYPLDLDETEISLLCGICIICPDRCDLEEPDRVELLQEPLLEALRLHSRKKRPSNPQIFPKLLMKIADLRTISLRGAEQAESLKMEIPTGTMPPLISEMLLKRDC